MESIKSISEIQEAVRDELKENRFFVLHNIEILIENSKTIEYEIKSAMGSLGIVATVSTPDLTYRGDYADNGVKRPYWVIENGNVVVVENPTLNRGRANYATALDTALQIALTLQDVPSICNTTITQTTQGGLVVVNVQFKTNVTFALERG